MGKGHYQKYFDSEGNIFTSDQWVDDEEKERECELEENREWFPMPKDMD